jgi:phosphatidylserine/phosphatidylglycerophosphate/cardiolipin synthase-like enzyme
VVSQLLRNVRRGFPVIYKSWGEIFSHVRPPAIRKKDHMSIDLKVYDNGDHTCLVWLPSDHKPIPDCRGFAIKRVRNGRTPEYLHGFVGFSDQDKLDPLNPWKFPVQRYMWWDYLVDLGDTVEYSVVPVVGSDKEHLQCAEQLASPMTEKMTITGQSTEHIAAYFNKGIVAAQWVSRALAAEPKGANIKNLVTKPGDPLRNGLSGLLRPQIISLLDAAKKAGGKIYVALYELNDPELIDALTQFGQDCNLILANGAFKPPDNDENKAVRAQLKSKVRVFDRIVSSGHFAHNKVVVICDSDDKPTCVLTGSTNWTSSGLCTQANNGLIINDAAVAQDYLDAWNRIHAAGNAFPPNLINANSSANSFQVDGCRVTPWHVPTSHAQDLDYARKLINAATEGILFLFFNPGTFQPDDEPEKWTLLQNILNRHHEENNAYYNPNLYIKGVVNQDIPYLTTDNSPQTGKKPPTQSMDPTAAAHPVALYSNGNEPPQRLSQDVLVPANIKQQFSDWEQELLRAGIVNIHSKVIVLDPFGRNPVVMTGSHNLGFKASSKNDDNLIIVEGNGPLAASYAVNIIATFQTYRWNSYVEAHRQDPRVWHGLEDDDKWQGGHLTGDSLAELQFWMGMDAASVEADAQVHAVAPLKATASQSTRTSGPVHRAKSVSTRKMHDKATPPNLAETEGQLQERLNDKGSVRKRKRHPAA